MEKKLNSLKKMLESNFIEIGDKESMNALINNDESLFLSITECGLKWQKKKKSLDSIEVTKVSLLKKWRKYIKVAFG